MGRKNYPGIELETFLARSLSHGSSLHYGHSPLLNFRLTDFLVATTGTSFCSRLSLFLADVRVGIDNAGAPNGLGAANAVDYGQTFTSTESFAAGSLVPYSGNLLCDHPFS